MIKIVSLFIILLHYSVFSLGQEQKEWTVKTAKNEIELYFNEAAKGKGYYLSGEALKVIDSKKFLKITNPYLESDNRKVRYSAIKLLKRKGIYLATPEERYPFVILLIEACKDKDSGNSGAASLALTQFNRNDFSEEACDSLLNLLKTSPYYLERIIQLVGFIDPGGAKEYLRETFLNNPSINKKKQWAAHLALARMGESTSMHFCLGQIKTEPVNDNVVYYLFPDLLYTRQEAAIQFMLDEILTDEKKCFSSNPDSEAKIICAYRIMELIAPVISNFPLQVTGYGELEIDDYDLALKTVRDWINSKPELQINNDFY